MHKLTNTNCHACYMFDINMFLIWATYVVYELTSHHFYMFLEIYSTLVDLRWHQVIVKRSFPPLPSSDTNVISTPHPVVIKTLYAYVVNNKAMLKVKERFEHTSMTRSLDKVLLLSWYQIANSFTEGT